MENNDSFHKNIVSIIPARGGSKSIPRKNIKPLGGKPLIVYSIESAQRSSLIDRVIVSTDDPEIAEIAQKYGAEVPFIRPDYLSHDTAPTQSVLEHAVKFLEKNEGYQVDIIVTLQPTSPFRHEEDIDQAIKKLLDTDADKVVSLCEAHYSPYWIKILDGDRVRPFVESSINYDQLCRQKLPKTYQLDGSIYVTKREALFQSKKASEKDIRAIIIKDKIKSIDIDNEIDFLLAETIIKANKIGKL